MQGVNRGFEGLVKEYRVKWLLDSKSELEAVAPLNVDNGFAAAILSATRLANHEDNVKDLLSNYIDGQLKAFV